MPRSGNQAGHFRVCVDLGVDPSTAPGGLTGVAITRNPGASASEILGPIRDDGSDEPAVAGPDGEFVAAAELQLAQHGGNVGFDGLD